MPSYRTPSGTEPFASDIQGDGTVVQQVGTMVWSPSLKEWVRESEAASDVQPGGYHNVGKSVPNSGEMLWNGTGWVTALNADLAHEAAATEGVMSAVGMQWGYDDGKPRLTAGAVSDGLPPHFSPVATPALVNHAGALDRQRSAYGANEPQSTLGMVPVVPQLMNAEGKVAPLENAQTLPDNTTGASLGETAIGLCNGNGNFDQMRNNLGNVQALASEARTVAVSSPIQINWNHSKLHINLQITGNPGGGKTLTVSLIDSFHTIATFVAQSIDQKIDIGPGLLTGDEQAGPPTVTTQSSNQLVPAYFYIHVAPSDASSWTYRVSYELLV